MDETVPERNSTGPTPEELRPKAEMMLRNLNLALTDLHHADPKAHAAVVGEVLIPMLASHLVSFHEMPTGTQESVLAGLQDFLDKAQLGAQKKP
ncbi:MAG: hypothetical protein KBD05_01390 [Candidatus Pacebacteria bacterium]|nr:hypothetical protein [Candidatus Paceibacterota bacterium]